MIYDIIANAEKELREWLAENAYHIQAEKAGLDERVGKIWVSNDAIVCEYYNVSCLDYYGGFQYVDKKYRNQIGKLIFYYAEDERVMEAIEYYYEND